MFGLKSSATLMYYLLTGVTFYLVAYDVLFTVPRLGPVPQPVVKAAVFVVLHVLVHRLKKMVK
jgi:hypothetical protein